MFTGKGHMPAPTKAMWLNNSNSVIGNVKWHYDVVHNTLPKIEFIALRRLVVDGLVRVLRHRLRLRLVGRVQAPDMTASCTNPFVQMYPKTPLKRVFDTKSDIEIIAGRLQGARRPDERPAVRRHVEVRRERPGRGVPAAHHRRVGPDSRATRSRRLLQKAAEGIPR
jgi:hypothetical protein